MLDKNSVTDVQTGAVAGASQVVPTGAAPVSLDGCLEELSRCWGQGERVLIERYLPLLGQDTDALLPLLYQEIVLRQRHGERPQLQEYIARFPHLESQLSETGAAPVGTT